MRNPQRCFLLPPLFSQSTFCKALQGTRQLYDDSTYSSLTTQIHTHTNSKLYNCREERGIVLYAKCIYFFSSSKQKKKKKSPCFIKDSEDIFSVCKQGSQSNCTVPLFFCLSDAILKMCLHICNQLKCRYLFFFF